MTQNWIRSTIILGLFIGMITPFGVISAASCSYPCTHYKTACDRGCGLFFGVEGLYWNVTQTNLDYAVDFDPTDPDIILGRTKTDIPAKSGKTHFIDYDWRGGVRGYFGHRWCQWDLMGVYTWYQNHTSDNVDTTKSNIDLKAALLHPSTGKKNAEKASGDSDFDYQTADLLMGRNLTFCNCSIVLHPFFGVRALKLEQELKVVYEGEDFVRDNEKQPVRVDWNSELEAIGLHAGLDMLYRWHCGFGFYGSFAGSVLASRTDVHHLQSTLNESGKSISTEINLKERQNIMVPGYHLTTGLSWDTCCGRCMNFSVKVGYEFNHWFDIPQLRRYHYNNEGISNSATSSDVGVHGATLYADLTF